MRKKIFAKEILNERGFIFVETIFLAMILSFTAIIVVNGLEVAIKSNQNSAIRLAAIHLANARMAEIEADVETNLNDEDLIIENFLGNKTIQFVPEENFSESTDHITVTVKVSWIVDGNENFSDGDNFETVTKKIFR